jgi:hypothetical protein
LQLHISHAFICIHEHSLNIPAAKEILFAENDRFRRVEHLRACFNATKSWFDAFLSLSAFPVACYPQLSLVIFGQLAHCIVALFRLSTFESPDVPWDRQIVLRELNFGEVLRIWSKRWEKVAEVAGLDIDPAGQNENPWNKTGKSLTVLLNWWDVMIAPKLAVDTDNTEVHDVVANPQVDIVKGLEHPLVEPSDFSTMNLDGLDDIWTKDMFEGYWEVFKDPFSLV